mgnify:CR=1 FL=1
MSRVIKFRAWTGKRMLTIDPLERKGTLSDLVEDESWKVMQFTGLTDRNGVEIYEGDICNVRIMEKSHISDKWRICEVLWGATHQWILRGYYTGKSSGGDHYGIRFSEAIEIEILGNIYEQPELLEAKP